MSSKKIISSLDVLGKFLAQFKSGEFKSDKSIADLNRIHKDNFLNIIEKAEQKNPWFTPENITSSFSAWSDLLDVAELENWLSTYTIPEYSDSSKTIGIVMAGNLPLVGFHDFLSVLLSGHKVNAKLSSKDDVLLPAIVKVLTQIDPDLNEKIYFEEEFLKGMDAVIATGSDNSSRYFDYYFKNIPHIIRKNRNSVAILKGSESDSDLKLLADDVFMYFGLGCRNVSMVYLPEGFPPTRLLDNFEHYHFLANHNKFANNHDYQKAILLVNSLDFLDNDFLILRENESLASPVATLHYQFYKNEKSLKNLLETNSEKLQCIVSKPGMVENSVDFGKSQFPDLKDYADNVDTMKFLLNLYT
jgi:hypothetical protein